MLDTVLRIRPADGTPPLAAARRLTVPMDYLAVLHHTKEVVVCVSPNGRSYVVDWHRTSLLAGLTTAKVIAQDGREFPLPRRCGPVQKAAEVRPVPRRPAARSSAPS